ncbi:sugar ABC transporter permease [Pseudactinotalea suaedae]|uniref:sugar ABC transporter permease n=1 Tax=Pseudactinotalea suaedae TaxID=1524924 RepID=UPI0012E29B23|nr:sugar ABC transporter permease [Pseudactinotalea suaedae]
MTMPPTGPGPYQPDGGAQQPGPGGYQAEPGGYEAAAGPYGGHPYPQPGDPSYASPAPPSNTRTVGWVGVAALYALVVWQLVIPTVSTLVESTRSGNPIGADADPVGLQNWSDVLPQLGPALGFAIVAVLPVTVVAAVLGFVIGGAMTPQQQHARAVRVVVGVLAALFVPLGIGLSRFVAGDGFGSAAQAQTFVVVVVTLAALPLLTAAFATAFAVALAGRAPGRGVAAVLLVGVTGALALGPQLFELPFVFGRSGADSGSQSPTQLIYQLGFIMFDFGRGAAVAGFLLLLAGVLGIVAVLALLLVGARLGVREDVGPPSGSSGRGVVGAVIAGVVLLAAVVLLLPVLAGGFAAAPGGQVSPIRVGLATWVPAAIATVLQVGVAVLGGAAIGWCRPAGRRSLWLLLPLAPWLFVGPAPLMLARYLEQREMGILDTWVGRIPGPTVVVGAVVVMAMLFAGMRERTGRTDRRVVGAAAAGAAGVLLITQAQSLLPSLIVSSGGDTATAPVTLVRLVGSMGFHNEDSSWLLGLLYPLPMLLLVAALGVLAQLGLRRVELQTPHQPQPPEQRF